MNVLQELLKKWYETSDMDYLFKAMRMALSVEKNKECDAFALYDEIVQTYYDMKDNPTEKNKYNKEMELFLLNVENYIREKVPEFQPKYEEIGDQLGQEEQR